MQIQELNSNSVSFFVGKRCGLTDEEIKIGNGLVTIAHFNTISLMAKLGYTVTDISKGILIEIERNIKIIEKERSAEDEQNKLVIRLRKTTEAW